MAKAVNTLMTDSGGRSQNTGVNTGLVAKPGASSSAKTTTATKTTTSTKSNSAGVAPQTTGAAGTGKSNNYGYGTYNGNPNYTLDGRPLNNSTGSSVSQNPGMTSEAYHALQDQNKNNTTPSTDPTKTPDTKKPTNTGGGSYTPSSSGGGSSGGGSSTPAASSTSTAPTTADKYAQAASTVSRITQGVDMSEKIKEANDTWTNINNQYATTTQPMIDNAGNDMNQAIDQYANESQTIIDQLKGLSDDAIDAYARDSGQTIDQVKTQINEILAGLGGLDEAQVGRVGNISTAEEEQMLAQIIDAQKQQSMNQIDYTTQQGINELQRAEEDAAPQFQTMRNQIAANEQQALDNQALYAEMRGDRGGIGQAQYGAIQNTAATNQLTVNREQTKLATDTARQIADLRAQGEFKKADALLELTQSYLKQLMDLKMWGDEMNVGIDEFNIGVEEWEEEYRLKAKELLADTQLSAAEYTANLDLGREKDLFNAALDNAQQNAQLNLSRSESLNQQKQQLTQYLTNLGIQNAQYMSENQINQITNILNQYVENAKNLANTELSAANLTGVFSDNTPTMAMDAYTQEQLKSAAEQLLASGLSLTDDQIAALGWTKDQYNQYKAAQSAGSGGGGNAWANSWYARTIAGYNKNVKNNEISLAQYQKLAHKDKSLLG